MKTLFGMFGCTQISTLLLVLPAAGAIAATQPQKNSQPLVDVTVESREARATVDGNDAAQSVASTPQLDSAVCPYTQRQRTFKR